MSAGRPAKPTALKLIDGTFRKDRAVESEMMPSTLDYAPSAPKSLSREAKREWNSVCIELIALDMLHRVDLGMLAMYCNEMSIYWEADRKVKDEGYTITIETKFSSYDQVSPWVGIKNTAMKNAQVLANQFGFTPSARAKINTVPKDESDPLTALLKAKMNKKNENQPN